MGGASRILPRRGRGTAEGGGGGSRHHHATICPLHHAPHGPPPRAGEDLEVLHQKYPSCFFFSMPAPPASLSIARPWRSLVVVSSISRTTSASVAASLSTAPVSG